MDKISKVVPTSRNYDIDMSKERPMRSGMPSYGLPVSMSSTQEKRILEQKMAEEDKAKLTQLALQNKGLSELDGQNDIVDKITLSFKKIDDNSNQIEKQALTLSPENSINLEQTDESEGSRLSLYA